MIRPYREVLALPGALAFSAAGFLARLPISMLGLGIVLLVVAASGSYAVAGAVAATFGVVQAVAAPRVARLVDRFGQRRVMRPAVCIHATGLGLLVVSAQLGAPSWTLFASAAVAGLTMGSVGSLVRARWTHVLGSGQRLHTAFSLESVVDELIFIVGPIVVTLLATKIAPAAGLGAAGVAALVGGLVLTSLHATEPPSTGQRHTAGTALLRLPGLVVLVVAFVGVGGLFGSAEVTAVAFTEERGNPAAVAVVLACFALGSLIAGLGYGAVQWHSPVGRRFLLAVVLLAAGVVPFAFVTSVPALGAVMFLAGFAISPMLIAGNALVQLLVPPQRLTEGLTWVATALGIGTAAGAAVSGWAIETYGAHLAFRVSVCCGLLAAAVALAGARWLRTDAVGEPAEVSVREPVAVPGQAAGAPATAAGSRRAGRSR